MSLLHQDSPEEADAIARGEELTKGSSHVVWASISAAVIVSAAIALYVIVEQKPPRAFYHRPAPALPEPSGLER